MQKDEDEGVVYGQRVRDAMQLADFFLRNDAENEERLSITVARFLNILFGTAVETPTVDETSMSAAMSAATGSACMSRQVGAVITSLSGDIIGSGTNDVPKFNGGLYKSTDKEKDHRCFKWRNHQCHNDERKEKLFTHAKQNLVHEKIVPKAKESKVQTALMNTGLKSLIEFSRSIHAEMEAIISVARSGKFGLVGGTLYSTTFPCHGCARHIVASGITKVIYIEPYAKSLALELHDDSISVSDNDQEKVKFLQYEGVAPRNMIKYFKDRGERKLDGKLNLPSPAIAKPVTLGMLDGLKEREQLVVAAIGTAESKIAISGIEDGQKDGHPA